MRVAKCKFVGSQGGFYFTPLFALSWERGTIEIWFGWLWFLFVWQWWKVKPRKGEAELSTSSNKSSFKLPNLSDMKEIVKQHDIDKGNNGEFDLLQIDGMCIMYDVINKLVNKKP